MNRKDFKKGHRNNAAVLFKITSRCNDNCKFCIERRFMRKKREDLSFKEIRDNFEYLRNNFDLEYVVITGGEPTLHQDFLKIINYFHKEEAEFRVITNLLKFSDNKFLKRAVPYFLERSNDIARENKIIGSINDLPINQVAARRIMGLKNVLEYKLTLMLIVVIYKENLGHLPELILYLAGLFKKSHYDKSINIELRLMYIEGTLKSLLKMSLPTEFGKIKESVQKAIRVASSVGITITLWNFPLCYLDKIPVLLDKTIQERRQRILLKVNKDFQLRKIQVRDFEEYLKKDRRCSFCKYDVYCSGIDGLYLSRYHFPPLNPVF